METAQVPVIEQSGYGWRGAQEGFRDITLLGFEEITASGDVSRNQTFGIFVGQRGMTFALWRRQVDRDQLSVQRPRRSMKR